MSKSYHLFSIFHKNNFLNYEYRCFFKVFPPSGQKSLLDDTKEVLAKSSQQWGTAKEHGKLVKNANTVLETQKQAVLVLKDTLNNTGIKDNKINVKLRELQSNSKKCTCICYKLNKCY